MYINMQVPDDFLLPLVFGWNNRDAEEGGSLEYDVRRRGYKHHLHTYKCTHMKRC